MDNMTLRLGLIPPEWSMLRRSETDRPAMGSTSDARTGLLAAEHHVRRDDLETKRLLSLDHVMNKSEDYPPFISAVSDSHGPGPPATSPDSTPSPTTTLASANNANPLRPPEQTSQGWQQQQHNQQPHNHPADAHAPPFYPPGREFDLFVRQQPMAARACGNGDGDRRVVDPPPTIELRATDPGAQPGTVPDDLQIPFWFVHCTIWSEDGSQDMAYTKDGYRTQRRLTGVLVAVPFVGADEHGRPGAFFLFTDLSVRVAGRYRLRFQLVYVNPADGQRRRPVLATAWSDVLTVFHPRDFPGMTASSHLILALKRQGAYLRPKRGFEKRIVGRGNEDSEEEGPSEHGGTATPKKKARKK